MSSDFSWDCALGADVLCVHLFLCWSSGGDVGVGAAHTGSVDGARGLWDLVESLADQVSVCELLNSSGDCGGVSECVQGLERSW